MGAFGDKQFCEGIRINIYFMAMKEKREVIRGRTSLQIVLRHRPIIVIEKKIWKKSQGKVLPDTSSARKQKTCSGRHTILHVLTIGWNRRQKGDFTLKWEIKCSYMVQLASFLCILDYACSRTQANIQGHRTFHAWNCSANKEHLNTEPFWWLLEARPRDCCGSRCTGLLQEGKSIPLLCPIW